MQAVRPPTTAQTRLYGPIISGYTHRRLSLRLAFWPRSQLAVLFRNQEQMPMEENGVVG